MDVRAAFRDHGWQRLKLVGGLAVVVVFVFVLVLMGRLSTQLHKQSASDDARASSQQTAIDRLASGIDSARTQLQQHGLTPSVPPPAEILRGVPGPAGPAGLQGPGPSDVQVQSAVDAYLAVHPPASGAGASDSQVIVAVTAYLHANPPPPGPPGPGPTDTQISDAVAVYMAAHPPPAGPQGSPGPQGSQGVAGSAGAQGPAGPTGATGPPPAGWTFTDLAGVTYDCAPDGQKPAPHYTCTARPLLPLPGPTTSTVLGLPGAALANRAFRRSP